MDGFPFNLIVAVATASATIFLGFLPTKSIRSAFFARETLRAAFAWVFVAAVSPPAILHFPAIIAFLCFVAWWHFRHDDAFRGKIWLNFASGFGISIGVMLILAVTPRAYPPGLSWPGETLLLTSIYLGGAVIGLAYVSSVLAKNSHSGVSHAVVQRYVGLLFPLVLVRAGVLVGSCYFSEMGLKPRTMSGPAAHLELLLVGVVVIFLPALAFLAQRASGFSSRVQPTRLLVGICLFGFFAEVLTRLLVL